MGDGRCSSEGNRRYWRHAFRIRKGVLEPRLSDHGRSLRRKLAVTSWDSLWEGNSCGKITIDWERPVELPPVIEAAS